MSDAVVDINKMTDPKFVWNFCNVTNSDGSPFEEFVVQLGETAFTIRPTLTMLSSVNVPSTKLASEMYGQKFYRCGNDTIVCERRDTIFSFNDVKSPLKISLDSDGLQRMRIPSAYAKLIKNVEAQYYASRDNGQYMVAFAKCSLSPETHAVMVSWAGDLFVAIGLDLEPITEVANDRN